jgi:hypothetical protein
MKPPMSPLRSWYQSWFRRRPLPAAALAAEYLRRVDVVRPNVLSRESA